MKWNNPVSTITYRVRRALVGAGVVVVTGIGAESGYASQHSARSLAELSLEELASLPITSVSKRSQPLATAPASIYVLREDEIRRSAAGSLPELLRQAPNLHIARVDAGTYAIASRGFNGPFANKMLVLLDGHMAPRVRIWK